MKRIICFLFLTLSATHANSQAVAIQNDKYNVLYIGIDNYLTIAVEQCPYDSVIVTCDNGTISPKRDKDHNHFTVVVDSPGTALIEVKKKDKEHTVIDATRFSVRYLPNPTAYYVRKSGGEIALSEMNEDFAPYAKLPGFERVVRKYVIDSFTVLVIRNEKVVFLRKVAGGRKLDDTTLAFFKTLQEKDKLLFTYITCKAPPETKLMHLNAMEFVIKNSAVSVNGEEQK